MASTLDILKRLTASDVEFVLVGGMASVAHGSSYVTEDLDVCAKFSQHNMERILSAIKDLNPRWWTNPQQPALSTDPAALATYKNLYLETNAGRIDIMSEITGLGGFEDVSRCAVEMLVGGTRCLVINLEALIRSKRAAGRSKDIRTAVELEAIRARNRPDD